jgi:hypothetical protein
LSLYKSRKTIIELLEYSGFDADEYTGFNINEIDVMFKKSVGYVDGSSSNK